jgi:hypothetical protein
VCVRFSAPVQTGPGAHADSYTTDTGTFPEVKRPGFGINHQPPSRAEIKKIVEIYLYSLSGISLSVLGCTLPVTFSYK